MGEKAWFASFEGSYTRSKKVLTESVNEEEKMISFFFPIFFFLLQQEYGPSYGIYEGIVGGERRAVRNNLF